MGTSVTEYSFSDLVWILAGPTLALSRMTWAIIDLEEPSQAWLLPWYSFRPDVTVSVPEWDRSGLTRIFQARYRSSQVCQAFLSQMGPLKTFMGIFGPGIGPGKPGMAPLGPAS